jgi:septal ring-binding cell division protein DamX
MMIEQSWQKPNGNLSDFGDNMKIFVLVLTISFLFTSSAYARTWFVENVQNASCNELPAEDITDPSDAIDQLRQQNIVPQVQENNGPDGQLSEIVISYTQAGGNQVGILFFTSMAGCQDQLSHDIKSGAIVDPKSLH